MPEPVTDPGARVAWVDRRVLVVAPRFFGYETRIVEGLERLGAIATYVDDRPSNSAWSKAIIRLSPSLIRSRLNGYHRTNIRALRQTSFDDLLFIVPESCTEETIGGYREAFPRARARLYMWDSFENKKRRDVRQFLGLFDRTFSFDDRDCAKYGMTFRPLFYAGNSYSPAVTSSVRYEFSFIGTVHSDRYKILQALRAQAERAQQRHFIYSYLPSQFHFWLYKATKREFRRVRRTDVHFDPMAYSEVLQVMSQSAAIVDIEHPDQRGLTMRTLETIGAGQKLITTNPHVRDYPFYSPERVLVIDRRAPKITPEFASARPAPLPADLLWRYSLDGWLHEVFGVSRGA